MTVYDLIKILTCYDANTEVKVCVVGEQKNFEEYKAEAEGCEKMEVGAVPVYAEFPYYDAEILEIVCELEAL